MEDWIELYPPSRLKRTRRARIIILLLFCAVALGGLLFCVHFCLRAEPGAERPLLRRLLWTAVPCGWVCIALYRALLAPLRRFAEHAEHMLTGERETLRGTVTVTDELVYIRRSIAVRTLLLDDGAEQRRLSVCAPFARQLGNTPRGMSLAVVHGYVAAFSPAPPDGPAPRRAFRAILRGFRRFFAGFHNYVLWLLLAGFLCAFAAMRVTDVPPAERVTVMIDANRKCVSVVSKPPFTASASAFQPAASAISNGAAAVPEPFHAHFQVTFTMTFAAGIASVQALPLCVRVPALGT